MCREYFEAKTIELDKAEARIKELVAAGKGYLGNGHEPTDGDIVHVPEHCRQCRLEKALTPPPAQGDSK